MSYEDKILDKFADMIMPPGTIIAYQGIEAPEGFIVYDHIKIYEDEFPRLYPVLAANPNFNKGADSDGRKWVELPEIEDLCIQMTTDTSQVGKTLEAQLPNITGTFEVSAIYKSYGVWRNAFYDANGAFVRGDGSSNKETVSNGAEGLLPSLCSINASRVNPIYAGTKVQPSALQTLPCIRC